MEDTKRHPFSYTLGPGPYSFVGFGKIHTSETFGARYIGPELERGCGTCAHCGHAIMNICVVKTGDGKLFGVGNDCIDKVKINGNFTNLNAFELEIRKQKRVAGQIRREKQRQILKSECENTIKNNQDQLSILPHPTKDGQTALNYCNWYITKEHTIGGYKIMKQRLIKWGLLT